jgi:hypothetical protein
MDLLAQSTFRADAVAIADDQHPDQQFRVDRRPPSRTIEWRQVRPDIAKVDEAIDRSQHMVDGHMLLEREIVKQSTLIDLPLTHHHLHSRFDNWSESAKQHHRNSKVFQQNQP